MTDKPQDRLEEIKALDIFGFGCSETIDAAAGIHDLEDHFNWLISEVERYRVKYEKACKRIDEIESLGALSESLMCSLNNKKSEIDELKAENERLENQLRIHDDSYR